MVAGDTVLTAALADVAGDIATGRRRAGRRCRPRPVPDGVVLSGTAFAVPSAHVADRVLVPAALDGGVVVAVVDPTADGRDRRAGRHHQP